MEEMIPVSQSVGQVQEMGEGFDVMQADDLIISRVGICQPTSRTVKVAAGHWYDTSTEEDLGESLKFFVLAKRNTSFTNPEDGNLIEKKEVLAIDEKLVFPFMISLSTTGYFPFSGVMTKLYKEYGRAGRPIFAALIEATTELTSNTKGKYYLPKFTVTREASPEEIVALTNIYRSTKPLFVAGETGNPSKAPFAEPGANNAVEDVMDALEGPQNVGQSTPVANNTNTSDDMVDIVNAELAATKQSAAPSDAELKEFGL